MELHIIRTVDHPIVNKLKYYFFLTTDKDELLSKIKNWLDSRNINACYHTQNTTDQAWTISFKEIGLKVRSVCIVEEEKVKKRWKRERMVDAWKGDNACSKLIWDDLQPFIIPFRDHN